MAISILSTAANERSTYVITASFTDEDGDAVTPATMTWTLTDTSGNVINSRQDVSISSLSTSVDVVLSGADLQISGTTPTVSRDITFEGTYDSDLGTGLPLTGSARFTVTNFMGI